MLTVVISLLQQAEQKITELDPEQRQEYENLVAENRQLGQVVNMQRTELEEINIKLAQRESQLRLDSQKLRGQFLKEQIVDADRRREDLELQLNEVRLIVQQDHRSIAKPLLPNPQSNLSFPEARDKLKNRVIEDNALIAQSEKRTKEIQRNIDNYEKKVREINSEMKGGADREAQKQKYEIIYQKDKEMNDFISNYQQFRDREIEQINQIEQSIITNLEHSSKILHQTGNMPSQNDYQ